MERERHPAEELLRRVALDYHFGRQGQPSPGEPAAQTVPLNIYETENDIVIVAPMPGVEADDVEIEVLDKTVTLRAAMRGPKQERRQYLLHEWTYGPYERTVVLPIAVDSQAANASHGNGVLVLSLPKAAAARVVRVPLRKTGAGEGRHQGHSGHGAALEESEGPRPS